MIGEIYRRSMEIGNRFSEYETEETYNWSGSEECATLADLVIYMGDICGIKISEAIPAIMDLILGGYIKIQDHMWDDYCKGFLAGRILGEPNETNIQKAIKADELWNHDDGSKYGYYQEALNEANLQSVG